MYENASGTFFIQGFFAAAVLPMVRGTIARFRNGLRNPFSGLFADKGFVVADPGSGGRGVAECFGIA